MGNHIVFFTYVMISENDNKLYVGFTNNLERRVEEHHNGVVASTANRRPLRLIYYEACLHEEDALKREKYFKTGFGRRFLKNRLESYMKEIR